MSDVAAFTAHDLRVELGLWEHRWDESINETVLVGPFGSEEERERWQNRLHDRPPVDLAPALASLWTTPVAYSRREKPASSPGFFESYPGTAARMIIRAALAAGRVVKHGETSDAGS